MKHGRRIRGLGRIWYLLANHSCKGKCVKERVGAIDFLLVILNLGIFSIQKIRATCQTPLKTSSCLKIWQTILITSLVQTPVVSLGMHKLFRMAPRYGRQQ